MLPLGPRTHDFFFYVLYTYVYETTSIARISGGRMILSVIERSSRYESMGRSKPNTDLFRAIV